MIITVDEKIEGKYPSVKHGKAKYGVSQELLSELEIGKSYEVVTKSRFVPNTKEPGGKPWEFKDIVTVLGLADAKTTHAEKAWGHVGAETTNGESPFEKKEAQIKELSNAKNDNIARCAALNNSLAMVESCANGVHANALEMEKDAIYEWLRSIKDKEYSANCKLLGIEEEVPF